MSPFACAGGMALSSREGEERGRKKKNVPVYYQAYLYRDIPQAHFCNPILASDAL